MFQKIPAQALSDTVARQLLENIDAGAFPCQDPRPAALGIWSAAHGIAALIIANALPPWAESKIVANQALRSAVLGFTVTEGCRRDR